MDLEPPVAERSDIFSEYYQLEDPERDRSKGLGLGLYIVKRLCEILGVGVSVGSDSGTGTMFHLDIPAGKENSQFARDPVDELAKNKQSLTGALVAVIDDDASVRRGMVSMLESLDIKAIAAESANKMIVKLRLKELMPDILLVDYRLRENQTGDKAIQRVRSAFSIDFPAMIITGDTSPSRMKEAANSGFELLHKPVEPADLVQRINRLLTTVSHLSNAQH